jgi:hypothetical protein
MFLLFNTVKVASEYIPPSESGCLIDVPVGDELAVEPGNLSEPIACKDLN